MARENVGGVETAHTLGRFGGLGLWTADHRRGVVVAWLALVVGLGGLARFAEHALSGAGWMATGSQSDREAKLVDRYFPGQRSYALVTVVRADTGLRTPAGRIGYRSEAAFARAFKRVIGIPPGAVKKEIQAETHEAVAYAATANGN